MRTTIEEYGDAGLLVTFHHDDAEERWRAAQTLQSVLLANRQAGIVDVVASFETAYVSIDLLRTDHNTVAELITSYAGERAPAHPGNTFRLPVVYGGERGPDLEGVAAELGFDPVSVIKLHTSEPWTVRLRGSPVAAPMMDGPALPAAVSRNPVPRTRLPAGSVALSGRQCIIYPVVSPGGWRLIGQTPIRLFDLTVDDLVPYRPGDRFEFFRIGDDEWDRWADIPLVAAPGPTEVP